ncbi:MAG: hypothetical protein Q4C36_10580 [Coriobacteriia bacterium]|nr:hypothetical protein [Coriobacteriia bacterium]
MNTTSNTRIQDHEDEALPDLVQEAIAEVEAAEASKPQDAPATPKGKTRPTILIMHSSVGSGHRSAADAIGQMLEKMRDEGEPAFPDGSPLPPDLNIMVLDSLDYGRIHFNGDRWASSFTGATRPYSTSPGATRSPDACYGAAGRASPPSCSRGSPSSCAT